jgi:uncharacterized protein
LRRTELSWLATFALGACLHAQPATPAVALIIDDLGHRPAGDRAALALPGAVTFAILPHSPAATALAVRARASGRDVLLHLPMEAEADNHLLGAGALRADMARGEFVSTLHDALASVPYLSGVNNHMGSRLTRDRERMDWLMAELRAVGSLLYVDSRTTPGSTAAAAAAAQALPYAVRDVFLDNRQDPSYIERQFERLLARAARHGDAVGIAHPHPATLAVLARRLPALAGMRLVGIRRLIAERACRRGAQVAARIDTD